MRQFVLKLFLFFLLQALVIAWTVAPYRPNPNLFWASTVLKHERLSRAPAPRMIFVGGSNVAFGVNSGLVEDRLPYAAVNMGLDAGLGLDFLLNEIKSNIRPGDVVVLSPEYELFLGLRGGQATSLARVLEQRAASLRYLDWVNVVTLLDHGFGFFHWIFINARRGLDQQKISGPYSLSTFDEYGDAVWHLDRFPRPKLLLAMEQFQQTPVDISTIEVLNRFHEFCRGAGTRVYLSHPPLPDYYSIHVSSRVAEVEQKIYRRVTIPELDRPADMFLPVEEFYDTEYHLLRKGRERRTLRIVESLREQTKWRREETEPRRAAR